MTAGKRSICSGSTNAPPSKEPFSAGTGGYIRP
jgi:hypothetical protein